MGSYIKYKPIHYLAHKHTLNDFWKVMHASNLYLKLWVWLFPVYTKIQHLNNVCVYHGINCCWRIVSKLHLISISFKFPNLFPGMFLTEQTVETTGKWKEQTMGDSNFRLLYFTKCQCADTLSFCYRIFRRLKYIYYLF